MENLLALSADTYLIIVLASLIVLLVLITTLAIRYGKKTFLHRKLDLIGIDTIENALLKDAVDDDLLVDFLVLQPNKIIIATVLPYEGIIFASEKIDQWTQVIKSGSFKFHNPYQNFAMQKNAMQKLFSGIELECQLFFPHASFPKDKPDAVIEMSDLPERKQYKKVEMRNLPNNIVEAWNALKQNSK